MREPSDGDSEERIPKAGVCGGDGEFGSAVVFTIGDKNGRDCGRMSLNRFGSQRLVL